VGGEGAASGAIEMAREPGHPAEHLHGLDVEVGPLATPGADQPVDLVVRRLRRSLRRHGQSLIIKSLDMKISRRARAARTVS
jgi:hypothetical protein